MTEKMFFLLTDFVSHKVRIIVVVIRKWAADNGKRLVRTNWKIGLFSEKKIMTEKQKKDRGCFVYTWDAKNRHSFHSILCDKNIFW